MEQVFGVSWWMISCKKSIGAGAVGASAQEAINSLLTLQSANSSGYSSVLWVPPEISFLA